jgi:hypothetical protein
VLPSTQAFPPLDIERVASDLRLRERAEENGKLNRPATDSEVEDVTESDVLAEIERRARKAGDEYRSQLELYDGRIRRAFISTDQRAAIEAAGESALADFKVQTIDDLNHLYNARRQVEGREREFDSFRKKHKISRLPKLVQSRQRVVRWLFLAIFVISESTVNGLFFAKGSETGIIGGVLQAFVLSLFNVGVAVLFAMFGLPLVRHVFPIVKAVGVFSVVLYAASALGINLAIGHFRDLFSQNAGQVPVPVLVERITTTPFMFVDAESMLLVFLGMGLSLLSLIDSAGMEDPYWGYGEVGQNRDEAIRAYASQNSRCLAGLTERRDSAIRDLTQVIEETRAAELELQLAVEGRSRLHENYRAFLRHLVDSNGRLLQRYREANVCARSTAPPKRFEKQPASPNSLDEPPPLEQPDLSQDARAQLIDRLQHFIKAINQEFEAGVRQYQTVAGLTDLSDSRNVTA